MVGAAFVKLLIYVTVAKCGPRRRFDYAVVCLPGIFAVWFAVRFPDTGLSQSCFSGGCGVDVRSVSNCSGIGCDDAWSNCGTADSWIRTILRCGRGRELGTTGMDPDPQGDKAYGNGHPERVHLLQSQPLQAL